MAELVKEETEQPEPERAGHKWIAKQNVFALIKDTIRRQQSRPNIGDLERITALCMPTMAEYNSLLAWWDKRHRDNGN